MAKTPEKKKTSLKVDEFDLDKYFNDEGFTTSVKDKDLEWIPLSEAFHEALGIPGIPKGYITLLRGYTNTGKSTGAYECMAACQKVNILPILIDTENSFSWEHAKNLGINFEEVKDENGNIVNYKGFFRYINNDSLLKKYGKYDYDESKEKKECRTEACVEDIASFIDDLLTSQANGKLPFELCFIWDSIGSVDCFKSIKSKSKNNMWNAGDLESSFKSIINHKIPSSKKEDKEYTNTFLGVQKIWLDSMQGSGTIKHKGGEAFFYAARLIVHFGGTVSHGTQSLTAVNGGSTYSFGIKTKVKCIKNQVNGIELEGKIASTPTGFMNPDKQTQYLKEHREFLLSKLGDGNIDIIEGDENNDELIF